MHQNAEFTCWAFGPRNTLPLIAVDPWRRWQHKRHTNRAQFSLRSYSRASFTNWQDAGKILDFRTPPDSQMLHGESYRSMPGHELVSPPCTMVISRFHPWIQSRPLGPFTWSPRYGLSSIEKRSQQRLKPLRMQIQYTGASPRTGQSG